MRTFAYLCVVSLTASASYEQAARINSRNRQLILPFGRGGPRHHRRYSRSASRGLGQRWSSITGGAGRTLGTTSTARGPLPTAPRY